MIRKTAIKRTSFKRKSSTKVKSTEDTGKMYDWFISQWDKREDKLGNCYCYETGIRMNRNSYRENTSCYHHLLEKGIDIYKAYKMEEWNLVIILPAIHYQVHSNIEMTPKIYNETKRLRVETQK